MEKKIFELRNNKFDIFETPIATEANKTHLKDKLLSAETLIMLLSLWLQKNYLKFFLCQF